MSKKDLSKLLRRRAGRYKHDIFGTAHVTRRLANAALRDVIAARASDPGFLARLIAEMNRLEPTAEFYRQQVEPWLCSDPERRVEPRLSVGLLILKAFDNLRPAASPSSGAPTTTGAGDGLTPSETPPAPLQRKEPAK